MTDINKNEISIKEANKIEIDDTGRGVDEALNFVERFASSLDLSSKDQFRMRLLAEETLGMLRAIIAYKENNKFHAQFWIEWHSSILGWKKGGTLKIHLNAKADLDYLKRRELISVSTKHENIAPRGIMEKVRELVEVGLHGMDEILKIQSEYGSGAFSYVAPGAVDVQQMMYSWSMRKYKAAVDNSRNQNKAEWDDAWDELEKSIIANVADDVQVGISNGQVELIVMKDFLG